jgi:hypothetical protein
MRMKFILVSLLLCLAILGHSRPALTASSTPIPPDLLRHLQQQGWTQVSPGVMQRSLGGNRVETLGFGAAGLRFHLKQMKANLVNLRKQYSQHSSRDLRASILAHRARIQRIQEALKTARAADELELSTEALIAQGPNCSANYDSSGFAYPLAQGVSANARAWFNNNCGYNGEVWAHAQAKATSADGATTLVTKSDPTTGSSPPRIGLNVSASSTVSANGVSGCESYAYASVTNYDLGITYEQSDRNYACVETLPSPWVKSDVGAVGLAGSASHVNGVFELTVGGTDLAGTADAFHFVHQSLTGDGEIVANVTALLQPNGANWTLAGVTFRNDLTAGSPHATMMITSQGEAKLRRRATAGGTTLSDGPGTGTTFPPRWIKLVRSGNVFTASLSADGVTWTQVHTPQTVTMTSTVRVGLLALRNGNTAPLGAARFEGVNVRVTPPPVATGNPFTYPTARDQFLACYGIAGQISSNCRDISDVNDRQMCYGMSDSTQTPCTQSMTDRNLQLACYGMSIDYGSNCRDITDVNMRQFCYGVSYNYAPDCDSIANANTRQLCYAMATSSSSYCSSITNTNDRQFCYAVSTRNSQYCASIQ